MSLARNGSALRDHRLVTRLACVGGCGRGVRTSGSWGLCPECHADAYACVMARVRGLSGGERREALNAFWGSRHNVSAALAEARVGVGI